MRVSRSTFKMTRVGETEEVVSKDMKVQRHVLRLLSGIKRSIRAPSVTYKFC